MVYAIILILLFLLGASIGSFLSVVNYRVSKNKKGIIFGHSYCPSCRKRLTMADMVPLVSYLALRGRCRNCEKKIPAYYFFLELICGLVVLSTYLKFPFLIWLANGTFMPDLTLLVQFIFFTLYGCFFVGIFFYDMQTSKIPDLFLYPLIGLAVIGTLVTGTPEILSAIIAVIIAFIFFGGQILISKGKWLGDGDLYLGAAMAIMFGWELFLVSLVCSYLMGAVISIPLLLTKKATLKSAIPFGPFLIIGAFLTIFFGRELVDWYASTLLI